MSINFSGGMSISTDTDFKVIGSDGSTVKTQILNSVGTIEKGNPVWRCASLNQSGQYVAAATILPLGGDQGGEGNHYNFNTYKFICPVPGNYRMSINSLICGPQYPNSGIHVYGMINGTLISNGIHATGDTTFYYLTAQWIGVVKASAGDALYFQTGGGRLYGDGWTWATYQLLG